MLQRGATRRCLRTQVEETRLCDQPRRTHTAPHNQYRTIDALWGPGQAYFMQLGRLHVWDESRWRWVTERRGETMDFVGLAVSSVLSNLSLSQGTPSYLNPLEPRSRFKTQQSSPCGGCAWLETLLSETLNKMMHEHFSRRDPQH